MLFRRTPTDSQPPRHPRTLNLPRLASRNMPASTRRSSIAHEPTRSPSGPLSTTDARTREAARENPQAGCGPGGGTDGAPDGTGRSTSGRAIVAHDGCAPASVSPSAPAPNLPNTFTSGVATAHGLPPNRHACCPHHGAGAARVTQIIIIRRKNTSAYQK